MPRHRKPGSQRDRVAELMADGLAIAEIAVALDISPKAVAARMADIRRDLGAQAV